MLMRILCGVLCACCVFANATEIYKTKDKNGNWIYTDQPPSADSEQVKLPPINTLPPAQNHVPISNSTRDRAAAQDEHYEVRIISPRENVTIPPGQRDLAIAVNLSRPLDPDHLLMFFINGELLEETRSSSVLVQEVYRGAHTVNGRSLGKSPEVIVNVIRPSLNSPLRAGPRAN
jgi:hypothetical protein